MMTGWFRRARQTRSTVTNREEAHRQQRLAACAAYRMLGYIQVQQDKKQEGLANLNKAKELGDTVAGDLIERYGK